MSLRFASPYHLPLTTYRFQLLSMRQLSFDKKQWEILREVCEQGYPKEVCGLLFGRPQSGNGLEKRVEKIAVLENVLDGKHSKRLNELMEAGVISINKERALKGGCFEFVIDPKEHYEKISQAMKDGLDQIGLFHSHPDHPAAPSATDAAQPFLAGWSNVIAAVHGGKFKEAKSWFREIEQASFQEEKILVQ